MSLSKKMQDKTSHKKVIQKIIMNSFGDKMLVILTYAFLLLENCFQIIKAIK